MIGLDCSICLMTQHVLQEILAILHMERNDWALDVVMEEGCVKDYDR